MKIRNGFVSNSSSSSFVILVKAKDYKEIIKKMGTEKKKYINCVFGNFENTKLYGEDYLFAHTVSCSEDRYYSVIGDEHDYDMYERGDAALNEFMDEINKAGGLAKSGGY